MTDALPALRGSTTSEILAQHLNSHHSSRKAFIQSEADGRITRALRSKIRASEERYENGDILYYKRENQSRWLGPAKVVFQDGKIIFVRHSGTYVRVSANQIIKAGQTFMGDNVHNADNSTKTDNIPMENSGSKKNLGVIEEVEECVIPEKSSE